MDIEKINEIFINASIDWQKINNSNENKQALAHSWVVTHGQNLLDSLKFFLTNSKQNNSKFPFTVE
jgi:hypothetical protein